ncbi:MAG: hypothetical protein K2Q26_14660 [Bdellovibrionales bacterium]|nr:hypothetical protein [Bdellovibrionales bacterium]
MWPQKMLMVKPDFFDIKYSINPHMVDKSGQLKKIDKTRAVRQWENLKQKFESLDLQVEVIEGQPGLPDMVFCANQMFPFYKNKSLQVILSRMQSIQRQDEVEHFHQWATQNNIECYPISTSGKSFEGMGDLLWNYETQELFGGYGYRTEQDVYTQIGNITGLHIHTLKLVNENFYHLDTCLCILNKDSALYVEEAFTPEGLLILKSRFRNLIRVPSDEAVQNFAANACCLHGTDVVIQKGSEYTSNQLKKLGFRVHPVETSEFMKAGGSVFCMKLLI